MYKTITKIILFAAALFSLPFVAFATPSSVDQQNGYIQPLRSTDTIRIPSLTNKLCIGTDSNGSIINGTCSGGGTNYLTNSGANTYLNTGSNLEAPKFTATSSSQGSTFPIINSELINIADGSEQWLKYNDFGGGVQQIHIGSDLGIAIDINYSGSPVAFDFDNSSSPVEVGQNYIDDGNGNMDIGGTLRLGQSHRNDLNSAGDGGIESYTGNIIVDVGKIGVGSTTPYAQLSVSNLGFPNANPLFAVASSTNGVLATTTYFLIDKNGATSVTGVFLPSIGSTVGTNGIEFNGNSNPNIISETNAGLSLYNNSSKTVGLTLDQTIGNFVRTRGSNTGIQANGGFVAEGSGTTGGTAAAPAYALVNQGNGMFFPTIGGLLNTALSANSQTRIVLSSNGNAGFNSTTTPYAAFSIQSTSTPPGTPQFVIASSTNALTQLNFIVDSNGNVGIGTTTPVYNLTVKNAAEVFSDSATDPAVFLDGTLAGGHKWEMFAFSTSGHGNRTALGMYDVTANKTPLYFDTTNWNFISGYGLNWTDNANFADSGTVDVGLKRNGVGILEVDNGVAGTFRDLKLRNLTASGAEAIGTSTSAAGALLNIGTSGAPTVPYVLIGDNNNKTVWGVLQNGHIIASSTALTVSNLSSCGTTPSITGDDVHGKVTLGTGLPTTCTITFNTAYSYAPESIQITSGTTGFYGTVTSLSASSFTITASGNDPGGVFYYEIMQ